MTNEQKAALDLAVLNLKTHGDDQLLRAVQPLIEYYEARALLADGGKGEAVATLHDDGYWTWKKGTTPPHESNYAGWRMDVYAAPQPECAPREAQPVAWCRRDTVFGWKGQLLNIAYMFPSPEGLRNPIPLYAAPTPERADADVLLQKLRADRYSDKALACSACGLTMGESRELAAIALAKGMK
jgi:hypothetical protein